jgi:hypothetical protein
MNRSGAARNFQFVTDGFQIKFRSTEKFPGRKVKIANKRNSTRPFRVAGGCCFDFPFYHHRRNTFAAFDKLFILKFSVNQTAASADDLHFHSGLSVRPLVCTENIEQGTLAANRN